MGDSRQISSARLFLVALGTFTLMVSSAVVSNSTSYFIAAVTEALQVTRTEFSAYYTIVSVCTAIGSILCGSVITKIGNRKGFLIGTVGVTLGFLLLSRLTSLGLVYIAAAFIGFCQAFIVVPPVAVVNQWFPTKNNGLVIGVTMAGTGAGGIVMAQIMPRIVAYIDWRTGYLVCAVMFCALSLLGNLFCGGKAPGSENNGSGTSGKEKADKKKDSAYMKNVASVAFALFVAACVLKCFSSVFNQHLSAMLQDTFTVGQVATAMTVFNVVLVIMKISQGALYEKLGYRIMLILVFISSFSYYLVMSHNFAVVLLGIAVMMFCCSTETVLYPLFLSEGFGKKFSSAAWGICWGSLFAGNALGAMLWGWIYDTFGNYYAGLRMQPVMVGIVCVIVFIGITLAKKQMAAQEQV